MRKTLGWFLFAVCCAAWSIDALAFGNTTRGLDGIPTYTNPSIPPALRAVKVHQFVRELWVMVAVAVLFGTAMSLILRVNLAAAAGDWLCDRRRVGGDSPRPEQSRRSVD
jgi:hypothetical protein